MPRRLDRNFRCQPGFHHSMTKASWSPTLAGRPRRRAWAFDDPTALAIGIASASWEAGAFRLLVATFPSPWGVRGGIRTS
jgi:hypothetical protein